MLPDCAIERPPQILRLSDVEKLGLETQGSRRPLDLFPLRGTSGVAHIDEGRESYGSRNQFLQESDPFRVYLRYKSAQPRHIRARACETRDNALPNRIANPRDDHGNRSRGILGRQGR